MQPLRSSYDVSDELSDIEDRIEKLGKGINIEYGTFIGERVDFLSTIRNAPSLIIGEDLEAIKSFINQDMNGFIGKHNQQSSSIIAEERYFIQGPRS